LERAKHLDYVMRTVLFEGHWERGCNAYGGCERNIIALSIRNRGRELCVRGQGCGGYGDFQGVSSAVSQYNIWDEYLTQISGLTSCFLNDAYAQDSQRGEFYSKLQRMYEQNLADVQRILFGSDEDLEEIFPGTPLSDLKSLRHYYHAPAMGKCFPNHPRMEYISGAVARNGDDFALLANTRIRVDERTEGGYYFRDFVVKQLPDRDEVELLDRYSGFSVDARKIELGASGAGCTPYGIARGCDFDEVGRYRKTPSWLNAGKSVEVRCHLQDRGEKCTGAGTARSVSVGGRCDVEMRPMSGIK
jgi:hypothetical protein